MVDSKYSKFSPQVFSLSSERFTFGKYKGKRYEEVLAIDKEYLDWCADKGIIEYKALSTPTN